MSNTTIPAAVDGFAPLKKSIRTTCSRLQSGYLSSNEGPSKASAKSVLANLRKFGGTDLQNSPLALEQVLFTLEPRLSPESLGKGDAPSRTEEAAFTAMVLFAMHMQSATMPMHDASTTFAGACGKLYALDLSDSIKPRVDAMLLARDESSRINHLRSLISLLRSKNIAFDYGRFAEDLRGLKNPAKRSGIQLRWGRDFAYGSFPQNDNSQTSISS
ncbi:type I-E CRISPR-associated protein Cse2/CasB [Corynebacterium flavescens]|uniref:type I-E CRISPR-associated protein Cse2/CasB n=1 Tax=Corynebacterium flavescens TaxID=28028 RepID=UPI003FD41010